MKNSEVKGIYIHVPFCTHICSYCDFCKVLYNEDLANGYLKTTLAKIKQIQVKVKSIYIGGGSPSSLNKVQLEKLLSSLQPLLLENGQFCIELNPEDLDDEKIDLLVKYGINRVSFGVQTLKPSLLKLLNRHHDEKIVQDVIYKMKEKGITNINLDLMYGLPYQTNEDLIYDINKFISFDVPHISTYALLVEDHTFFKVKKIDALDDDLQAEQFDLICSMLKKAGYFHYEISNFAKKGYESVQNLIYWRDECYIGIGPSSSGYENGVRYDTSKSITSYIGNNINKEIYNISKEEEEYEYIMLHLRLSEGIDFLDYKNRFGFDFLNRFKSQIESLCKKDLINVNSSSLSIKEEKFFISNLIINELLENIEY
ncbi:MAG: radical SAM family heme chaperone HemW [Bacilli bacterium]|nr:radical SAM family heme chaperone HemW [Bacilli bacterium]